MAMVCREIQEWVEEEVSQPVEEWEERQEEKCKKYPWYDPRGWVCWFVTVLVKVIRWVVVTVGTVLSEVAKERLKQNHSRMIGTLGFWKKQAEIYKRFHYLAQGG